MDHRIRRIDTSVVGVSIGVIHPRWLRQRFMNWERSNAANELRRADMRNVGGVTSHGHNSRCIEALRASLVERGLVGPGTTHGLEFIDRDTGEKLLLDQEGLEILARGASFLRRNGNQLVHGIQEVSDSSRSGVCIFSIDEVLVSKRKVEFVGAKAWGRMRSWALLGGATTLGTALGSSR